jgi:regulatory protein
VTRGAHWARSKLCVMNPRSPTPRRGSKPVTPAHLENVALYYLERFASSSANLHRVLMRKVKRSAAMYGTDAQEGEKLVDEIIARYLGAGLLDDRVYAAQKVASLLRHGTSSFAIRGKLAVKGVEAEVIDETLGRIDQEAGNGDLGAACALVRRRRLGPYRPAATRPAFHRRDLAILARAGFSFAVARRVIAARDIEALEALGRKASE